MKIMEVPYNIGQSTLYILQLAHGEARETIRESRGWIARRKLQYVFGIGYHVHQTEESGGRHRTSPENPQGW